MEVVRAVVEHFFAKCRGCQAGASRADGGSCSGDSHVKDLSPFRIPRPRTHNILLPRRNH